MRNVTHDHTTPATCESVFLLAEALNMEIARLAMNSKGSAEIEGKLLDRLSRAICPSTKLFQGLQTKIGYAFGFEREVADLMKQGAVGELEVTTPAKLTDLQILTAQTTNNSWPAARAA
jgi:hypothetical protein